MVRLIINADDFGISNDVNDAIRLAFEKRMITTTTLMVNMPAAQDAVVMAQKYGFDDLVGLHLNLTAGVPLTMPIRSLPVFCDRSGRFHAGFHRSTATRLKLTREESAAARMEIEAQIRRYLTYGLPRKHLDSHHHVHTDPAIWKVLEPLLLQYQFRSVRLSRNMYSGGSTVNRIYKRRFNRRLSKLKLDSTEYFGSFEDFGRFCKNLPENALAEMMVHPMFAEDGELLDTDFSMEEEKQYLDLRHVSLEP